MTKEEFKALFITNIRSAVTQVEERLDRPLDAKFDIEFYGGGISGKNISVEDALDIMYLGEKEFYRIIDIGVKKILIDRPVIFVRISDHEPAEFSMTWNTPKGNGPFKIIEAIDIEIN